jgi:superfamily II DNA or RNA helicase
MTEAVNERTAVSSAPEDIFVELFAQVFGLDKVQLLSYDHPVEDIYGASRFIDYALATIDARIAFEIDGLTWHHPEAIPVEKFEDDLLRQNSLIHQGWRVFRWTDRELMQEPERVKEQLALFLESISDLVSFGDFLPKQRGETFELRPHQEEALASLQRMRNEGNTIALLTHAQGAGKTVAAISDAKRIGGRTLFLAHRRELVLQAYDTLKDLWPEVTVGLFMADVRDHDAHNIAGSIQSLADRLKEFDETTFDYLVIDEAHHAAAASYRKVLGYFRPKFVLGLTATPDRADGQSILELFQECAHRLDLKTAVEMGELVPIRCVRVKTNVDLTRVRFNQIQYNRKDIEERVLIPPRDKLIVDTYLKHVRGRRGVVFCVNIRHGENLAELFRREGIAARSVSGRMPRNERERYLQDFRSGQLQVLCACDILNEGWDCPEVEVLMMARPTLSKVIYLQQLGRGTRKAPGKECLIVFDFVDNTTRYNHSLNLHRVLGIPRYREGGFVLAPEDQLNEEEKRLANGEKPTAVLDIGLWARDYEEIDLFNWQEAVADMVSVSELEIELATSQGFIRRAIERGELQPDHALTLGDRTYHYFTEDRIEDVCETLGIEKVGAHNIKERFISFTQKMDMAASYKPVMMLALLDAINERGRARVIDVAGRFREFYAARRGAGLCVERDSATMSRVDQLDDSEVMQVLLRMPFEKFERRRFLEYDPSDLAFVRFTSDLWRQIKLDDLAGLRNICEQSIDKYYERLR